MKRPENVVELLQSLVRIPSVNPQGDPGTDGVGERRIAEWLAEFLEELGAKVELREVLPDRPNVVARWPGDRPGKPRVLFAPHTDTVGVEGMTIDPFAAELRAGRIWGRGASDTKGPMAAMLWALSEMRDQLPALGHEIWFAGLMSEETSQHGSKALAAEEYFDFVIAAEPTELNVVHTHKGAAFLQLATTGLAAHASRPELGKNAIDQMLDVLAIIRTELAADFARQTDPVLGSSTLSIGTIRGGTKTNVIPDRCEVSVDLRFVPGHFHRGIVEEIAARLRQVCPELEVSAQPAPPLFTDPAHPLIRKLGECGARPVGAPWFCDACYFAQRGMPAVALGPGSIAQAHTQDEFIQVEDLERGVEFFSRFLATL
ncbi:MAG TPA: M20 family metallopeptidase [Chthoniobacteraceae bacterium]|jgi:acetylornithine deacetylase/succinyl-diaminopimelate desuccinylase-like protein